MNVNTERPAKDVVECDSLEVQTLLELVFIVNEKGSTVLLADKSKAVKLDPKDAFDSTGKAFDETQLKLIENGVINIIHDQDDVNLLLNRLINYTKPEHVHKNIYRYIKFFESIKNRIGKNDHEFNYSANAVISIVEDTASDYRYLAIGVDGRHRGTVKDIGIYEYNSMDQILNTLLSGSAYYNPHLDIDKRESSQLCVLYLSPQILYEDEHNTPLKKNNLTKDELLARNREAVKIVLSDNN